jgi:hypothetical protein
MIVVISSAGIYHDKETLDASILLPVDINPIMLEPTIEHAILNEVLTTKILWKSDIAYDNLEDRCLHSIEGVVYIADWDSACAEVDILFTFP